MSSFRYKVNDIPNSFGRIFVTGSNLPDQPWRIQKLTPEQKVYCNTANFEQFREVRQNCSHC
jgi:hypothetical protein